jgi:hypothetical protein
MKPASRSLILFDLEILEGKIVEPFAGGSAHVSKEVAVELP